MSKKKKGVNFEGDSDVGIAIKKRMKDQKKGIIKTESKKTSKKKEKGVKKKSECVSKITKGEKEEWTVLLDMDKDFIIEEAPIIRSSDKGVVLETIDIEDVKKEKEPFNYSKWIRLMLCIFCFILLALRLGFTVRDIIMMGPDIMLIWKMSVSFCLISGLFSALGLFYFIGNTND